MTRAAHSSPTLIVSSAGRSIGPIVTMSMRLMAATMSTALAL